MNSTAKLLALHLVEQQIRGLTGRLDAAQARLDAHERAIKAMDEGSASLRTQARQLEATVANDEVEIKQIDERIGRLREQMNSSKTNKEYTSFQTEISTLKADRGQVEERAIASMGRLDAMKAELKQADETRAERIVLRDAAAAERDKSRAEIQDRLDELNAERREKAGDVPPGALSIFETRAAMRDEDIMAPLEEHDRKRHEYACGSCQVLLPVERLNALLGRGEVTTCTNCGVILYLEANTRDSAVVSKR